MTQIPDTELKLMLYKFFSKFPLREKHLYDSDIELFLAFIWLNGWKLVKEQSE
jgi:hypothetical protein